MPVVNIGWKKKEKIYMAKRENKNKNTNTQKHKNTNKQTYINKAEIKCEYKQIIKNRN